MNEITNLVLGLVLGAIAIILALVCGWQAHKVGVMKMFCRDLRNQQMSSEEVFKRLLQLLIDDGIDVNKYLTKISQQRREKANEH